MKTFRAGRVWFVAVLLGSLVWTGCGTSGQDFTAGFREKVSGPDFQREVMPGSQAAAFKASQRILYDMGFRLTRTRAAQGIVEAISGISSDSAHIGSRQRAAYVLLEDGVDGVEVRIRFTEIVEESFGRGAAGGTENTLRDTPLYQVFFRQLGVALAAEAEAAADGE